MLNFKIMIKNKSLGYALDYSQMRCYFSLGLRKYPKGLGGKMKISHSSSYDGRTVLRLQRCRF